MQKITFQICDNEGNLVFSKLQIQSNLNEQKSGQELNAVLALRKQKQLDGDIHAFWQNLLLLCNHSTDKVFTHLALESIYKVDFCRFLANLL